MSHTEGKLEAIGGRWGWNLEDSQGNPVALMTGSTAEAIARRIAACWNACEGIETEQLKNMNVAVIVEQALDTSDENLGLQARLDQEREVKEKLLDALKVSKHIMRIRYNLGPNELDLSYLDKAIALAEKGE